jgi:spermidine/putrescine transport system substrate-binding protein
MAYSMGIDPFAAYGDLGKYQEILDKVTDKLIACKDNVKTYWKAADDLSALMLSGEIVASETWDSTAYKLYGQNHNIVFVPPATGALAWIDTFALPRKGEADDAAYKWINFVMQPDIVPLMSDKSGAVMAVKDGIAKMPEDKRAAVQAAFKPEDIANLKFFANIPPGLEKLEGKALEKIQAASSN